MANARDHQPPSRTLEYKQAMKDFHTMFPTLERDIIECVLRSNNGHVDSTIDQLLQLTQEMTHKNRNVSSFERLYYTYDDSSESSESFPPEVRRRTSSSDDDQPPRYTPTVDPPPSPYTFSSQPVESFSRKSYRDWNPPLLGTLPNDFLRILPSPRKDHNPLPSSHRHPRHPHHHHHHHHHSHSSQPNSASRSSSLQHNGERSRSGASNRDHSSPSRRLQRRKTTGEVNVVLGTPQPSQSSPQSRMVRVDTPSERSGRSQHHVSAHRRLSVPATRPRQRSNEEQSQYMEDRKVALLLQNEEFLRELKRNEQFLSELNRGDSSSDRERNQSRVNPRESFQPITVDPLRELSSETPGQSTPKPNHEDDSMEDKDFRESLKHMSKSAKRNVLELAKRFNARRKSYKSMSDSVDPVFASCND